ncbi:hypothetical protein D3C81_1026770 [compost metagenome]
MHYIRLIFSFKLSHPTLSGLWYAFLWMMIGALGLSLLLQSDIIEETDLTFYIYIVHSLSALFGGLVSGKRAGRKGLYQGAVTGLFYGVLLFIISFLALDSSLTFSDLSLLLPALIIGAIGGVFGVNLHRK